MFKKGDKIKRITATEASESRGIKVGNIYTVHKLLYSGSGIILEEAEYTGVWESEYFELVEDKEIHNLIKKCNEGFEAFHELLQMKPENVFYTYPQWEGKTVPLLYVGDYYRPAKVEYKEPEVPFVFYDLNLNKEQAKDLKEKLDKYLGEDNG